MRRGQDAAPSVEGYRVFEPVGDGATSVVHRAVNVRHDAEVALKIARTASKQVRAQFEGEFQLSRSLKDARGLIRVRDLTQSSDGRPVLEMTLARGTLAKALEHGPLPLPRLLRLGEDLAQGLRTLHGYEMLHRDVKPGNVLLLDGEAVLGDLGTARVEGHLSSDAVADEATWRFAAPEVLRRQPQTGASDLYGLGATLYTAATGRPPFEVDAAAGLAQVLSAKMNARLDQRALERLPEGVRSLLRQLLDPEPTRRPRSAGDVARALVLLDATLQTNESAPPSAAPPVRPATPSPATRRVRGIAHDTALDDPTGGVPADVAATVPPTGTGGRPRQHFGRDAPDDPTAPVATTPATPAADDRARRGRAAWMRPAVLAPAATVLVLLGAAGVAVTRGEDEPTETVDAKPASEPASRTPDALALDRTMDGVTATWELDAEPARFVVFRTQEDGGGAPITSVDGTARSASLSPDDLPSGACAVVTAVFSDGTLTTSPPACLS